MPDTDGPARRTLAGDRTIVIAIADIKGGVGKTTTAMAIGLDLARRGETVAVLDADNTGGATGWQMYVDEEDRRREKEDEGRGRDHRPYRLPFDVTPVNDAILGNLQRIREQYRGWVIIDTPPSDTGTVQKVLNAADVTIIPSQTSVPDLTAAGRTYSATRNGLVLLTRVNPRTINARNAIAELDAQHIARFDHWISEREAVRNMYGTIAPDLREYDEVTGELLQYLGLMGEERKESPDGEER